MAFADSQSGAIITHGEVLATIKLAGAVVKGDAVGFSGGWKQALATVGTGLVQMRCVAGEDGVTGQEITAYFGDVELADRVTGATVGGAVYVAEGTSVGMYTQTAPTTTGDSNKIVGYAVTATRLHVMPHANVDSVA